MATVTYTLTANEDISKAVKFVESNTPYYAVAINDGARIYGILLCKPGQPTIMAVPGSVVSYDTVAQTITTT
jgi:hypothetical protein